MTLAPLAAGNFWLGRNAKHAASGLQRQFPLMLILSLTPCELETIPKFSPEIIYLLYDNNGITIGVLSCV
jgi:hypothetical protein